MNWPLTSLIPSQIEIFEFVNLNWPHIFWFPNWYLGVPIRFVTGPVVPLLIVLIHRLSNVSMEMVFMSFIGIMRLVGGWGIYLFVRALGVAQKPAKIACLLYIFLPFDIYLLGGSNGLGNIALGFLPWVWLAFYKSLQELKSLKGLKNRMITAGLVATVILIDTAGVLPVVIGLAVLSFIRAGDKWVENIIIACLILVSGFFVAMIWYTPEYFITLLFNPSFAGWPLINVVKFIGQLLLALIPLFMGILAVKKKFILKSPLAQFGVLFTLSFVFLTGMRFLSDPDFILDWTGYIRELQLGLTLCLALFIYRYLNRRIILLPGLVILIIIDGWILNKTVRNKTDTDYQIRIVQMLNNNVIPAPSVIPAPAWRQDRKAGISDKIYGQQAARYFFSGSPVFWLNSKIDEPVAQVRGGRDEVSTHKTWAMGAYQIREGEKPELMRNWLKILGVSKILVNDRSSGEPFRDFKNQERFDGFESLDSAKGDTLYGLENYFGRIADKNLLNISKPKDGQDEVTVADYIKTFKQPLGVIFTSPDEFRFNLTDINENEMVSIATTYDPNWKILQGAGKTDFDGMGNLVVKQVKKGDYVLKYQENWFGMITPVLCSLIFLFLLFKPQMVTGFLSQKLPSVRQVNVDEEQQY